MFFSVSKTLKFPFFETAGGFCFNGKIQIFFQRHSGKGQISGKLPCDVADMPGLVWNSGNVFFVLGIAENKSEKRCVAGKPFAFWSLGKFRNQFQANGRTGNIQCQSALVLTGSQAGQHRDCLCKAPAGAYKNDIRRFHKGIILLCKLHL